MIIYRCADRPSSDCRKTPSGSGAERQHATLGAEIEATNGSASQLRNGPPRIASLAFPPNFPLTSS